MRCLLLKIRWKWNQKRSNNSIKREISHSLCFTSHNWGSKKNICLLDTKQTRDEFQENHHDFRHFAFFLKIDTDVLPLRTKSNKRSPSKVSRHEYGNGDCFIYRNGALCWIDEQTVLQFKTIQTVVKLFSRILLFRHGIHNLESVESFLWLQSCSKPCLPFPGGGGLPLIIHLLQQTENLPKQNFE